MLTKIHKKMAYLGEPVPKDLDCADTYTYMCLSMLYKAYKKEIITIDEAQDYIKAIMYNSAMPISQVEYIAHKSLECTKRLYVASDNWKENPTKENGDKLYAAIYNLEDDWRNE